MDQKPYEQFQVSQVGLLFRDDKCLILKSAIRVGLWEFPGGRIDKGEDAEEAFRRELKEEVGFTKFESLGLIDYDITYGKSGQGYVGISQYIQNTSDPIVLSSEHAELAWITEGEIENYSFVWRSAQRMLKKGFELHRALKNK